MTQHDRIIRHLQDYGTLSSLEAIQEYGIMRLSARISELRSAGWQIKSENKKGQNRYGEATRYAVYTLMERNAKI